MSSSPSRELVSNTTGRVRLCFQAVACSSCCASGLASNFKLPSTPSTLAPSCRKRSASACVWANTAVKPWYAGRDSQAKRCAWCMLLSLMRALTNSMGTFAWRHNATQLGHTSVSKTMAARGWKYCKNRCTTAGVSHGCQTCTSPSCNRLWPCARPVAVPWVSKIFNAGESDIASRNACSNTAAARVSPSETACTHT